MCIRDRPPVCAKVAFDCYGDGDFQAALQATDAKHVVLCGMEAHICVLQTALGLIAGGYRVWVADDAVCSRNDRDRDSALDLMRRAGAVVAPTETLLFMWMREAGSPAFREISGLIKDG